MGKARRCFNITLTMVLVFAFACVATQDTAFAHCDTLDGPVVIEATAALKKADVTPVLKWVKKEYESEIKSVFKQVSAVRSKGPQAQEIADRYFFETLIRLHRAGEGAPFTGLKPAGTIDSSLVAADKAMESGSVEALAKKIGEAAEKAIRKRFARLMEAKTHKDESIEAGREYVEAYVVYVHFVEGLHDMITQGEAHNPHANEKEDEGHDH
jgi:hypothetical protein